MKNGGSVTTSAISGRRDFFEEKNDKESQDRGCLGVVHDSADDHWSAGTELLSDL